MSGSITPFLVIPGAHQFAVFVMNDGTLQVCGLNSFGQLGLSVIGDYPTLTQVPSVSNVTYVSQGAFHTLALLNDNTVLATGRNADGELGDGTTINRSTFLPISGITTAVAISCGEFHSIVLLNDGTILTFGYNFPGCLGLGDNTLRLTPTAVPSISNVVSISGGSGHSAIVLIDGTVLTTGDNSNGQLGNGSFGGSTSTFTAVPGITTAISVSCGAAHTVVLLSDGTVVAFGANESGQLGNGDTTDQANPVSMLGITNAVAIAARFSTTYITLSDGTAKSTGFNLFGGLGNGTTSDQSTPGFILDSSSAVINGIIAVANSGDSAYLLFNNGTVLALGRNEHGQLGFTANLTANPIPQAMTFVNGTFVYRMFDTLVGAVLCVHPDSLVRTKRGLLPIKDVVSGDIVYSNNNEVEVKNNIMILRPTDEFVMIAKNALGKNVPQNDLYIKVGHPIMRRHREYKCEDLINKSSIKLVKLPEKVFVYTLCTEKRVFVDIENLAVCTWREEDLNAEIAKGKFTFTKK
jgi:alpha-tubulin suppressor-like RCC1 family protein